MNGSICIALIRLCTATREGRVQGGYGLQFKLYIVTRSTEIRHGLGVPHVTMKLHFWRLT
jgi:hypothetical protein